MGRVGAHVSAGSGLLAALERATNLGLECLQVFVGQPQRWSRALPDEATAATFRATAASSNLYPVLVHAPYLVNLASLRPDVRTLSVHTLVGQLAAADAIGALGVVVHVGSGGDDAMEQAIAGLQRVLDQHTGDAWLILENDAGSGRRIGRDFAELGALLRAVANDPRLRFCLDTAHCLAAGYELRTPEGLHATAAALIDAVGVDRLASLHVNDSKVDLGRNVDRHANLGQGKIGLDAFGSVLTHPAFASLPAILEVPGYADAGPDRPNVELLRLLTFGRVSDEALDRWCEQYLPATAPRPS